MEEQKILLLVQFLRQFGGFGGAVTVDEAAMTPGSVGLFPGGQEETCLRRDILGNSLHRITWHFTLRYRAVAGEDAACRLEAFARWLETAEGLSFGADTQITAGKTRLAAARSDGCSLYETGLTVSATVSR